MAGINQQTRVSSIAELTELLPYLMYQVEMMGRPAVELSFDQMAEDQPTWSSGSMARGARRLADLAGRGRVLYDVYESDECEDDARKAEVKLIRMQSDVPDSTKPFVIGVAGGAYSCVCSLVESIPVAGRLNELGYQVFILNYRCGNAPVVPRAIDDLAAAVRFVLAHKAEFGIEHDGYVVNGFSAGANLTALWGTEAVGWAHYGLPRPAALFLMYPFLSLDAQDAGPQNEFMRGVMFGRDTQDLARRYDTPSLVTDAYPPCYVAHAQDDPVVSVRNTELLVRLLTERGILVASKIIPEGGHGWGDGTGTEAEGWAQDASAFVMGLRVRVLMS